MEKNKTYPLPSDLTGKQVLTAMRFKYERQNNKACGGVSSCPGIRHKGDYYEVRIL